MNQSPISNEAGFRVSCTRFALATILLALTCLTACVSHHETPQQRYAAAQDLFNQTTKTYHIPSADASGEARTTLQNQAAAGYEQLLKKYPNQPFWDAQALRSLGNIRAAQTNLVEAARLYNAVADRYPNESWEALMALKSAGDLFWDAGKFTEARPFYQKIITRYDKPDAPAIVKTTVHGAKSRLAEKP